MCAVPSASPCLPTPSLSVCRPEVQKTCDVFVFCLRAQLGICREAVCISTCPLQAGGQGGCSGPPCGAGLHRLSGHRSGCVTHLEYAGLEFCQSFSLLSVWCAQCGTSAHTHAAHTYPGTVTSSCFCASAISGSRCDGVSPDDKCFCVCAGARDYFINLT